MPTAPAHPGPEVPPAHLVLFDGECGVCNRAVQWLLDLDRAGRLAFAPLQGPTAADVRRRHPELPGDLDSIIYVERDPSGERVSVRAEAIFRLMDQVEAPATLRLLRHLPRWMTDLGYRLFATNRHRIGTHAACRLPTPDERARFLS